MGYFQDLGTGMAVEPMNASTDAQDARAFGWELAELMLDALRDPVSADEAAAIGHHAAEVIAERVLRLPMTGDAPDHARLWVDAASWGFRDRMAIAREIAEPNGERAAPVAPAPAVETDEADFRDEPLQPGAVEEPTPVSARPARAGKAKSKAVKARTRDASSGAKRRPRPAPAP